MDWSEGIINRAKRQTTSSGEKGTYDGRYSRYFLFLRVNNAHPAQLLRTSGRFASGVVTWWGKHLSDESCGCSRPPSLSLLCSFSRYTRAAGTEGTTKEWRRLDEQRIGEAKWRRGEVRPRYSAPCLVSSVILSVSLIHHSLHRVAGRPSAGDERSE